MDQRVRNLWSESDSSFIVPLIAKAERHDPLDDEDLVRVRALMRAEFVRCRFIFHNDLMASSNTGTTFGSLIYYAEIFGLSASQMWIDYRSESRHLPRPLWPDLCRQRKINLSIVFTEQLVGIKEV